MSAAPPLAALKTHVLVVANPRAGSGRRREILQAVIAQLQAEGLVVESPRELDQATTLADEWQATGRLKAVIAAGGDGTVAEVVNRTRPGTPVAVFPLGTANLLAHYLGIQPEPEPFARMIVGGHLAQLDAGRAGQRLFLLMMSCGFDADVVERLHEARRGNISFWSYAKPILDSIRKYDYPLLRIHCQANDNSPPLPPIEARLALAFNLPCYAGGLAFTPQACGTDGKFDLCTFGRGGAWHTLRYVGMIWAKRHGLLADCQICQTPRLRIESDTPAPYQLDGDPGGRLPVEVEILPGRLTLIVPEAERRRFETPGTTVSQSGKDKEG